MPTKKPTTTPTTTAAATIEIAPIKKRSIEVALLGDRPLIFNRLAEKARRDLLFPHGGRKTAADRAAALKHDPLAEFRASPDTLDGADDPTLLAKAAGAFKGAMLTAALRMPGATKTEIGQLLWVGGDLLPIYGIPELFMSIVRSADMNKTPDVRTRAIVPRWAARLTIEFSVPLLNERSVVNLLAAAGQICGIGDWRPEKLKGTYGQFSLVDPEDERFLAVVAEGGRAAQVAAMADPVCYDKDTAELLDWFDHELVARGRGEPARLVTAPTTASPSRDGVPV